MPKTLGLSFYIDQPVEISGTPIAHSPINNIDLHGNLVSLSRILGENNQDYKERLYDVSVHPGGPTYEGIINNINREFGYLRIPTMVIDLKVASSGLPIATSPRVDLLANKIILYSDWRPNSTSVIDKEVRIYKLDDIGYYLNDLVDAINESPFFSAYICPGIRQNTISNTLIRSTSNRHISSEYIHADKLIQFENKHIVLNSLSFIERDVFSNEVFSDPSNDGEYYVDYINGELTSYSLPSGRSYCSYMYGVFPFTIDSSPVQIFSFQDDNFQEELFNRKTLPSGDIVNSLPNTEGSELYHKLFKESEVFWGN